MESKVTDRWAAEARQSMQDYAATMGGTAACRAAIKAIMAYGGALHALRLAVGKSNKAFAALVHEAKLDQGDPWSDVKERSYAIRIAELGRTPNTFDGCPMTRPSNIMGWWRRKNAPDRAEQAKKAEAAIRELEAAGAPLTEDAVQQRAGVAAGTAHKALSTHKKVTAAKAEAKAELNEEQALAAAEAQFSEKSKVTLTKAIELHRKRLDRAFEAVVNDTVRQRIEKADDAVRKSLAEVRKSEVFWRNAASAKAPFTKREYRMLLACCHPDNSASTEVRNEALGLLVKFEPRLVREERP